jgi:methyl-accepting chemotaxis protein
MRINLRLPLLGIIVQASLLIAFAGLALTHAAAAAAATLFVLLLFGMLLARSGRYGRFAQADDVAQQLASIIEAKAPLSLQLSGNHEIVAQINRLIAMFREIIIRTRGMSAQAAIGAAKMNTIVKSAHAGSTSQGELSAQIFTRSQEASGSASTVQVNSAHISQTSASNLAVAEGALVKMRDISSRVVDVSQRLEQFRATVQQLDRSASHISTISSLINQFSEQTNLLALNAAIEAAHAGDHGRGFAVVAGNVRTLAREVKSAANTISTDIEEMAKLVKSTDEASSLIDESIRHSRTLVEQSAADFEKMVVDLKETTLKIGEISQAIGSLKQSNDVVHQIATQIQASSRRIVEQTEVSEALAAEQREATEHVQGTVAQLRTGDTDFDQVVAITEEFRDKVAAHLQALADKGINVFDRRYQTIPDSNPKRYKTCYDDLCEAALQAAGDAAVDKCAGAVYALALDGNGYAPAHNSKFSKPPTGDYATDLVGTRHKRIFDDLVGLKLARSEAPSLFQTYLRDTGETLGDLSMPVHVGARRWGAVRVGFNPKVVIESVKVEASAAGAAQ